MAHTLEQGILEKESRIRDLLEKTGLISGIKFHHHNHFSLKFEMYNNETAREIISACCMETYRKIRIQVMGIKPPYNRGQHGEINYRIDIDPTKKGASPQIIDSILTCLEQDLRGYMQRHRVEMRAYRIQKQKRTKS